MGFIAGTLVHTDKGLVPIEQIKVGDCVLSKDESEEGELLFQPVLETIPIPNVPLVKICLERKTEGSTIFERIAFLDKIEEENEGILPQIELFVTLNHPFWVEDKGWVATELLTKDDILLDSQGNRYCLMTIGYAGAVTANIYKTRHSKIGFIPYYGTDIVVSGDYIHLFTGQKLTNFDDEQVLTKLYQENDEDYAREIRETYRLGQDIDIAVDGFKKGDWINPSKIDWSDDQGLVTATVYKFEVVNNHTYFVGKYGMLVKS